ncbi:MAG: hypothetical protein QOD57_5454, partial [Actinomycetota bacterium]|nr:hypothetical protein [Actinomycetota bacterium]
DRARRKANLTDPGDNGNPPGTVENDLDDADRGGPDVEAEHAHGHEFALSAV